MNITPDYLIERKRNKTSLLRWKVIALILLILAVIMGTKSKESNGISVPSISKREFIASIQISDVIEEDLQIARKLKEIAEDDKIKALIVNINSPGGSVVGSEMIYNALRKVSKNKPVVCVLGTVAASGGYLVALGGDYIVTHNGTLTGSIGVLLQSAEVTDLAEKIGIKFENIKSSELKAMPNPFEKMTPEARAVLLENISDSYDYFTGLIAQRRNLEIEYVRKIADGRVYSGRQAYELKLVDEIGEEDTALKWLQAEKKIDDKLKIVDIKLKPREKILEMLIDDLNSKVTSFFSKGIRQLSFQ
jgi:protease IV